MPYTKEGIVPDLMISPMAIPSRMTIAQLVECILGKTCALEGYEADATPFTGVEVEQLADILQKTGFERYGTETLYNGRTGEQLEAKIFIGPTFYYRLKHLVSDKIHSRSSGPYQLLTKQPAEGRSRAGGLRVGKKHLAPKQYLNILLVCITTGNTTKFWETIFLFTSKKEVKVLILNF